MTRAPWPMSFITLIDDRHTAVTPRRYNSRIPDMSRKGVASAGYAFAVVTSLLLGATVLVRPASSDRSLAALLDPADHRPFAGRLSASHRHRPYGRMNPAAGSQVRAAAADLRLRWRTSHGPDAGRAAAEALLLAGHAAEASSILLDLLRADAEETSITGLIQKSADAALLVDLSAASLEEGGDRSLLIAYEAAARAWSLSRPIEAGWNRALAAHRIGMYAFAERAWREIAERETDGAWRQEAEERRRESARLAGAEPPLSLELVFYRDLFQRAATGDVMADVIPGDRMASDTRVAVANLRTDGERRRFRSAIANYLRGRDAVDASEVAAGRDAYAAAENELESLRVPLFWIARDQRVRCDCVLVKSGCVEAMRALRRDVAASGRYPWLVARGIYGEGQALYRHGRVYEAAQLLEQALVEFEQLGDQTAAAQMHVLLTNVYAAGGESDLALRHFLQGIAFRTPEIADRRRRMLEDGIAFMLRHDYLASAELLLDELATVSDTAASNVSEATLRGVAAFRRGDRRRAAQEFAEAHALLRSLSDESVRTDLQFRLAIAEAGSHMSGTSPILADLDAAIAAHSGSEHTIWLPQLLVERGAVFESNGDSSRAEADYLLAIEILEDREPRIDESVLALGLTTPEESAFDRAIRLHIAHGRIADALRIAERASGLRISSLHARGSAVRDVFRPLRDHQDGIAETQQALRSGEVAVAQHLLRDELITWVVTTHEIRAVRRSVDRDDILRQAAQLRNCQGHQCDPVVDGLSRVLVAPWIESVPAGATLLLRPAAEVEAIPFAALETRPGEPLLLRNAIATAPKLITFVRAAREDTRRAGHVSALFAAAPSAGPQLDALPRAVSEVTKASRRYTAATVEPYATRERFLSAAPSFGVVHFAGHLVVDPARPLFSALVFARGEMLYVHELDAGTFARSRLIVLSACDSGRSPRPAMSVANALLGQNVPSVVYTFRAVGDDVAEAFAVAFHDALTSGTSRAEAVRAAQLSLMRNSATQRMDWAAFGLAGAAGPLDEVKETR